MIIVLSVVSLLLCITNAIQTWPVPYKTTTDRPSLNPVCRQDSRNFCRKGTKDGEFPVWWGDDTIKIYALRTKKVILGDTVISTQLIHYDLGLESVNTKQNYTLSWDPLSSYDDTMIPRINGDKLTWCNQAAACLTRRFIGPPLQDIIYLGSVSAEHIAAFEVWLKHLNNTKPFQADLLVHNSSRFFHVPFGSNSIMIQAINVLKSIGAVFENKTLPMTAYAYATEEPMRLGNESHIRKVDSGRWSDIVRHYTVLQGTDKILPFIKKAIEYLYRVEIMKKFYYYYNGEYWYLHPKQMTPTNHNFELKLR